MCLNEFNTHSTLSTAWLIVGTNKTLAIIIKCVLEQFAIHLTALSS